MRTVLGLVRASHPFPLAAVVTLTALIGVASAGGDIDPGRLAPVLLSMLLAQLVIGWTNDYADRDADARYQPTKPIASGKVAPRLLPPLALAAGIGAVLFAVTLGPAAAVCVTAGIACGLAYNFGLKSTPVSWLPYVIAFCVLPPFVWSGLGVWDKAFLALYPIVLPLTVAAHLANALPDVETDREAGRGSVVVRLGRKATLRALALLLAMPVVLVLLSLPLIDYDGLLMLATLVLYVMLLAATWFVYGAGARGRDVWGFRLIAAASLVFVTGWLLAVK